MKLKLRHRLLRDILLSESGETLYIIKHSILDISPLVITDADGNKFFSVRRDPKPLDRRIKYIFAEHETGNEFFAWIKTDFNGPSLYRYMLSSGLEISLEAESFFGELLIKRRRGKFELYINERLRGTFTGDTIQCEIIDDPALLTVIYALTKYIIKAEKESRAPAFA